METSVKFYGTAINKDTKQWVKESLEKPFKEKGYLLKTCLHVYDSYECIGNYTLLVEDLEEETRRGDWVITDITEILDEAYSDIDYSFSHTYLLGMIIINIPYYS